MFNMESRHLLNLSVQNVRDCTSENVNLENFNFPEQLAPELRRSQSWWALYIAPILETFRFKTFKDEDDYEYEIWLKVFSRILKI